jgi:acyl-CoA dehydrogenase
MSDQDILKIDQALLWPALIEQDYVQRLRQWAAENVAPQADEIDREDIYPVEILKAMARQG